MRRLSSFGRILLLSLLFIVGLAVVMFALSSYFFSDIYTATQYSAVSEGLRAAEKLLAQYRAGNVDRAELWDAVNPVLSMEGAFSMPPGQGIRLLGVSAGNLSEGGEVSLFDDHEKKDRLYDAIDSLKRRFGEGVVTCAALQTPKQ